MSFPTNRFPYMFHPLSIWPSRYIIPTSQYVNTSAIYGNAPNELAYTRNTNYALYMLPGAQPESGDLQFEPKNANARFFTPPSRGNAM